MTQKTLAKEIGTSEVYLSMILRGKRSGKKYIPYIIKVLELREKNIKDSIANKSDGGNE